VGVSEADLVESAEERLGCQVVVSLPTFFVIVQPLTSVRVHVSVTEGNVSDTCGRDALMDAAGWSTVQLE